MYRLNPQTDATKALQSAAQEQLSAATLQVDQQPDGKDVAIHAMRKCCKRLRGLLRLYRVGLGSTYSRENAAIRGLARQFSSLRDRKALIETYDKLVERFDAQVDRPAVAPIRRALTLDHEAELDDDSLEDRFREAREGLEAIAARVSKWKVGNSPRKLSEGLSRTYERARIALADAESTDQAEDFHEWRKRVKYHRYHMQLLRPAWDKVLKARHREVKRLSDLLGDDHDLAVFRERLAAGGPGVSDDAVKVLDALAAERQRELRADALVLGHKAFAEGRRRFAERVERYWRIARDSG